MSQEDKDWAVSAFLSHPEVNSYGVGPRSEVRESNWGNELTEDQIEQIIHSRDFLLSLDLTIGLSSSSAHSSLVRNRLNSVKKVYVYHGSLVLAAKALGIPVSQVGQGPYVRMPVSKASLKALV